MSHITVLMGFAGSGFILRHVVSGKSYRVSNVRVTKY